MKKFNLAVLPLAVAGVLASTSAFAGTQACFEVTKAANNLALTNTILDTVYTNAACPLGARVAATSTDLAPTNEAKIAYELTNANAPETGLNVEFDAIDGGTDDLQIVYIPTTDIPSGTLITMTLAGATFKGNSDIIHLVQQNVLGDVLAADDDTFVAVASSDGPVDDESVITFLTKAGVTITAGTRLVLSRIAAGADETALGLIGINIGNTVCTDTTSTSSVTITATSAVTDGGNGYDIQGAVSETQLVADISPQFYALQDGSIANVNVNAESSDDSNTAIVARTEFVYTSGVAGTRLVANRYQAIYKTAFYNRGPVLDQAITLDAADHLETSFVASAAAGSDVEVALYNERTAATGVLTDPAVVETGTTYGTLALTLGAATVYNTEAFGADGLFTEIGGVTGDAEANPVVAVGATLTGADYNEMYYVLENTDTAEIMNFNYTVDTHYTLDFGTSTELDHCAQEKATHDIGVNGAVLKVPYVVQAEGNFVRITNEHDEVAEVTFDIFGESDDGDLNTRKVTAVSLGTIPANSSVVYLVPDIVDKAIADASYTGADGGYAAGDLGSNIVSDTKRHTVTFTVTAPSDSVHGVSVQKIIGGLDRVMPVLDQNTWSQ